MKQLDPRAVWLFFFTNLMLGMGVVLGLIFAGVGFLVASTEDGQALELMPFILLGLLMILLYVAAAFVWAKLSWHYYRYELREDGFRKEHGVIWKRYITIPYDRVQNVDIHRGVLARLLGLSDLQIQTAGAITAGSYGAFSEGRLPGVPRTDAERIRDELVSRVRGSRSQGL